MIQSPQKVLKVATSKAKGSVPWQTDGPTPEIKAVRIDWLTTDQSGGTGCSIKRLCKIQAHSVSLRIASKSFLS